MNSQPLMSQIPDAYSNNFFSGLGEGIGFCSELSIFHDSSNILYDNTQLPDASINMMFSSNPTPLSDETVVEIINAVQASDYVVLASDLRDAACGLLESVTSTAFEEKTSIVYNPQQAKIKIQGPRVGVHKAKAKIESHIQEFQQQPQTMASRMDPHALGEVLKQLDINIESQHGKIKSNLFYPIRVKQDSSVIELWDKVLVPALPTILEPTVGKDYTAALVRQGSDEQRSIPCIQIESPIKPSKLLRERVRNAIQDIVSKTLLSPTFCVRFFQGAPKPCVSGADDEIEESSEDSEDDESVPFPNYKRYWHRLGMSSSVGIAGSESVSSTAGGYIMVNNDRYLLLVDHLVTMSYDQRPLPTGAYPTVVSPSLSDIREVRGYLESTLRDTRAKASEKYGYIDHDLLINQYVPEVDPEEIRLRNTLIHLEALLKEVSPDLPDQAFEIGQIIHRNGRVVRPFFGSPHCPRDPVGRNSLIKLDWALCRITRQSRSGRNRLRYKCRENGQIAYGTLSEWGDGAQCSQMCDIEPNVPVYYVGRKSGYRRGEINGARTIVSKDGITTNEWFFMAAAATGGFYRLAHDDCAGDSGAWLLHSESNYVMAVICNHSSGVLLITPIVDVVTDISDQMRGASVYLPFDDMAPPTYQPIVEVAKRTKGKTVKLKLSTLPPLPALTPQVEAIAPRPQAPQKPTHVLRTNNTSTNDDEANRPVSPVPSLVPSNSSQGSSAANTPPASEPKQVNSSADPILVSDSSVEKKPADNGNDVSSPKPRSPKTLIADSLDDLDDAEHAEYALLCQEPECVDVNLEAASTMVAMSGRAMNKLTLDYILTPEKAKTYPSISSSPTERRSSVDMLTTALERETRKIRNAGHFRRSLLNSPAIKTR
jgi:hypothetical protein